MYMLATAHTQNMMIPTQPSEEKRGKNTKNIIFIVATAHRQSMMIPTQPSEEKNGK